MENTRVYDMKQVGQLLGLSKCTVYKLAHENAFPVVQLGKQYLSPRAAFDRWLETLERN